MSSVFPSIQPEREQTSTEQLPLCREVAWDFERGVPLFYGGRPVEVTGVEAVRVWAWKALHTVRCRHAIYTWDYGCEAENLIGRACTNQVKQSEAVRYVREALNPNPYITTVQQVDVALDGDRLTIQCKISTIYGEVTVYV
jgi:hypothetical protein